MQFQGDGDFWIEKQWTIYRRLILTIGEGEHMRKNKMLSIILAAAVSMNMTAGVLAVEFDSVPAGGAAGEGVTEEQINPEAPSDSGQEFQADPEEDTETDSGFTDPVEDVFSDGDLAGDEFSDGNSTGIITDGDMIVGGYRPSQADYNVPVYDSGISTYREIPSSFPYDMDTFQQTYPGTRNQDPYGTCWAFASTGLAEFDLINKGIYDKSIDLSELQLAYFAFNSVQDPLGGTAGDYAKYYNENASVNYLNYGGNYEMAARRLSQWVGSTSEAEVPYKNASSVLASGLDEDYAYNHDLAHLKNAYIINIKQNAEAVKENIMEHGAVGVMYLHAYKSMLWNSEKNLWTYYDTDNSGGGHAVMVVGWDDNFSKENFVGTEQPADDGAWLVRNSWGFTQSYFWMSYESTSLADAAWVFDVNTVNDEEYDNNYQCDGGLSTYKSQYTTVSNVFTVGEKQGVLSETLDAVSISCTKAAGISYSIDVYTDLTNKNNPASGTLQEKAHTEGTTAYAGIYTIPLAKEVELTPGSDFAVVVKTDEAAVDYEQATKIVSSVDNDGKVVWDCAVSYANGKSFYGYGSKYFGSWPWGNFCIKAFTGNNHYKISYNLNNGENNVNNPDACGGNGESIVLQDPTREGCVFEGWYLDSDFQTPITEIPANAAQDYVLYAKWTSATGEKFYGYTLNLDGTIAVNLYMELPEELKNDQNAYMEFTLPNGGVSQMKVQDARIKGDYRIFTCRVTSKEMSDAIKARMIVDDQKGKEYTVSIKEYGEYIINHPDGYTDSSVKLIKSLLNYGAAAQKLFSYNTDKLANETMSSEDQLVQEANFDDYQYAYWKDENEDGIQWYGSSLLLDSDTYIRDYFLLDGSADMDQYIFYVSVNSGSPQLLDVKQKIMDGTVYYYVDIPNIKAQNLDKSIVVTVQQKNKPGTDVISLQYNAFSYAYAMLHASVPDQKTMDVMNAMYTYWEMANLYMRENTAG